MRGRKHHCELSAHHPQTTKCCCEPPAESIYSGCNKETSQRPDSHPCNKMFHVSLRRVPNIYVGWRLVLWGFVTNYCRRPGFFPVRMAHIQKAPPRSPCDAFSILSQPKGWCSVACRATWGFGIRLKALFFALWCWGCQRRVGRAVRFGRTTIAQVGEKIHNALMIESFWLIFREMSGMENMAGDAFNFL